MAELLSCPFCGGEAEFVEGADDDGRWVAIGCPDCGAGSRQHYAVMEDPHPHAQSAWNTRASTQPAAAFPREDWGTLVHAVASLRAAISLLEDGGKKAAPSDKMFAQMLRDYHKAADAAAKALAAPPAPNDDLRAALEWLAAEETTEELLRCRTVDWGNLSPEERIAEIAKRKDARDNAILAARRNALKENRRG